MAPTDLTRAIRDYLASHSRAEDSLEGIAEWWILENSVDHRIAEVRQALTELVEDGMVERVAGDGGERFRLRRDGSHASRLGCAPAENRWTQGEPRGGSAREEGQ